MCGIAGLICRNNGVMAPQEFASHMRRTLEHRGPDDWGCAYFADGALTHRDRTHPAADESTEVVFVHRRLSILDLSPLGWQPMQTPDGRYHIVYNGEIYNFIELREELEALGHTFIGASDTEVLLHAYAQWGVAVLPRLVGMFAFVIYDTQAGELLCVRDFVGIKPFFYTQGPSGFAFASELSALTDSRLLFSMDSDAEAVYQYLKFFKTDYSERSFLHHVKQLKPGHFMRVKVGEGATRELVQECYWAPDLTRRFEGSFADASEQLGKLFKRSVDLHLRSDVPVGVTLSGGVDSSAITSCVRNTRGKDHVIHAFGYFAEGEKINESRWIEMMREHADVELHRCYLDSGGLWSELDTFVRAMDYPVVTTSNYAQFGLYRAASQAGLKVLLSGQGADEMLGGYPVFVAARIASLLKSGEWGRALRLLMQSRKFPGRPQLFLRVFQFLIPYAYQGPLRQLIGQGFVPSWLDASWFTGRGVTMRPQRVDHRRDVLRGEMAQTLTSISLPCLLRHEDRCAMSFSIENRVPFVTREIIELCLSLDESHVITDDGWTKAALRQAMRGVVPDPILDRKDKIGFVTPQAMWITQLMSEIDTLLNDDFTRAAGCFQVPVMRNMVATDPAGASAEAWRWINLIRWAKLHNVRI